MRPILAALITALLVVAGLAAPLSAPASAASSGSAASSAGADEPGYPIERFHTRRSDDPRLVKAWRAWRGRNHQRYTTVVDRSCFCLPEPPVQTVVRRRAVTSVTHQGSDEELDQHGYEMDELYRVLRRAYASADELRVRYHRGVPVSLYVDWSRQIADEELALRVKVTDTDPAEPFAYAIKPFRSTADDREVLRTSWQAWRESGIASYTTTVTRQPGEGATVRLRTKVDGHVVRRVENVEEGDSGQTMPKRGYEIERVYRMIRRLYRDADRVRVRYDEHGVPRVVSADPIAAAVDDEFVLRLSLRAA